MSQGNDPSSKRQRIERVRGIVNDDFERVRRTSDPFEILNSQRGESLAKIEQRYERYERFYRAENFQRLGDIDLTRKALEIRRTLARAINEVRASSGAVRAPRAADSAPSGHRNSSVYDSYLPADYGEESVEIDADRAAMAHIYFRDGLAFLQLGDLHEAVSFFDRASSHDPREGLYLAYKGYSIYRRDPYSDEAKREARELVERARELSPDDADTHVLRARFFLKVEEIETAKRAMAEVERLSPEHPMLPRLRRKVETARAR